MKNMNKNISALSVLLLTVTLFGCSTNQAQPRTQQAPRDVYPEVQRSDPNAPIINTAPNQRVQNQNLNQNPNQTGNMREARNIADSLVNKHNIRRAVVFVTDSTAYVSVDIPDQSRAQFTDQVKDQVANEVRRVDSSIQRVYVSAEPDVFTRFQNIGNDIRGGKPIQGTFDQFTELVRRIWPQQR